jgi:cytochrome c5
MRWPVAVFLGFLISGPALAGDALQTFASELLLHESRQVLRPERPLQYADPEGGAALRALLVPERASRVLDEYFEETAKGSQPPDVKNLLEPLAKRYERAFENNPPAYEQEYLDALHWVISALERSQRLPVRLEKPAGMPQSEFDAMQGLVQGLQSLADSMTKLVSQGILGQVNKGMFGPAGKERALAMVTRVNALAPRIPPAAVATTARVRDIASGKQVYEAQCVACHMTGIAGAPRHGDLQAWKPRIASGLNALVQATLKGKSAMPAMGGGDFQDFEIARAVAYLANLSGASFREPAPPPGHPGTVTMRPVRSAPPPPPELPYALMSAEQRLKFGERLYGTHCITCHQATGQAVGPIKSMVNAPAFRRNETAIDLLLYGSAGGVMPAWRMLKDEELAEVINFSRFRFNSAPVAPVTPAEVGARRR